MMVRSMRRSIGTSGLASFLFYYLVSARLERRRRSILRTSIEGTYNKAKRNIAVAVIQASRKGGRHDLDWRYDVEKALTTEGFKSLFSGGKEADEGFYAFQNQMSYRTAEYDEIVFNLRIVARAAERLLDSGAMGDSQSSYAFLVGLSALVTRIEHEGGHFHRVPLLDLPHDVQHLNGLDRGDRPRSEFGKEIRIKSAAEPVRIGLGPHVLAQIEPFIGDSLKGVAGCDTLATLLDLSFVAGVLAILQEALCFLPRGARLSKKDKGVRAEREQLLLAFEPIGEAPQHGACGGHEDMETF
jgi:hypothetical protein